MNTKTAPRAAPAPGTAPPGNGRMKLDAVRRGVRPAPDRILVVGTEGVGKSTFASEAPAPIFIAAEDGIRHLAVASFPEPTSFADVMDAEPISFDEATTLPVLLDYFAREAPPVVVVVQKARPTGIVTPESLATLIQRLSTGSFAPLDECAGRSGLIVPNLCMAT